MQRLGEQTATTPVLLCSYYLKEQMIAWQQETQKKKKPRRNASEVSNRHSGEKVEAQSNG